MPRSLALVLALSLAGVPLRAQDGYFDAHVHLNDPAAHVERMDRLGIPRALVFWGHAGDNPEIRAAAARWPDRLVPMVSVSPERRDPYGNWWKAADPRLLTHLEAELDQGGYRGIGELSIVHFPSKGFPETEVSPLHPLMDGIMRIAARRSLPVMVHCEMTYARELDALLRAHPAVRLVWAHGGYAPLYWTERMLLAHPGLVIELSMRTVDRHPRSPDYWILEAPGKVWPEWLRLVERFPDRFLVGSDATQRNGAVDESRMASPYVLLDQLSSGARRRVAQENFAALFGGGGSARAALVRPATGSVLDGLGLGTAQLVGLFGQE